MTVITQDGTHALDGQLDGAQPPSAVDSKVAPGRLKFARNDEFHRTLRQRVQQYFEETGLRQRDCPRMYLKTALIVTWLAASYGLLVFVAATWWVAVPLAVSMGLAIAAAGFNIQHDGNHGAYSDRPWINKLMAMTLDLIGGSSYVWARKHNAIHHSYTNVTGHDDDINVGLLGRLSPHQKRLKFHRLQHIYMWILYGFLTPKWHVYDDFRNVIVGRIGEHRFARPKGWDLATFLGGKVVFFTLAFVIPLLLHPVWAVLTFYGVAAVVSGMTLSIVFQLAHCVEEASFSMPNAETGRMESAWAVHQIETTVDFARRSRLLSWFVGGLNFQVEHHLFPQICHVHYAAISKVVEDTCRDFKLKYLSNDTLFQGLASHFRWLRRMGMPNAAA